MLQGDYWMNIKHDYYIKNFQYLKLLEFMVLIEKQ